MFTGIIEEVGKVKSIKSNKISIKTTLPEIRIGDSISINGVCLTATEISSGTIDFDFSPETFSLTNIGKLKKGEDVNIERALKIGDRMGGHFLTGHIEALGKVISVHNIENSYIFKISLPEHLAKYVVMKGSIGVEGISLTVTETGEDYFKVSVIPHTMKKTVLKVKKTGDVLNIETDVMAKYAEKISNQNQKTGLTAEKLKKNGFI